MNAILNDAWRVRGVSLAEKTVLVRLADRADDGGLCFPGQASIADELGVTTRTVSRAIARLVELGHVQIAEDSTPTRSRRYQVTPQPSVSNVGPDTIAPGVLTQVHPNHQLTIIEPPGTPTEVLEPELFEHRGKRVRAARPEKPKKSKSSPRISTRFS